MTVLVMLKELVKPVRRHESFVGEQERYFEVAASEAQLWDREFVGRGLFLPVTHY